METLTRRNALKFFGAAALGSLIPLKLANANPLQNTFQDSSRSIPFPYQEVYPFFDPLQLDKKLVDTVAVDFPLPKSSPHYGEIPARVPKYEIAHSIDWPYGANMYQPQKHVESLILSKIKEDQINVLVAAGFDREFVVVNKYRSGINIKMLSLMKSTMRRSGRTSQDPTRGRLTDLLIPAEIHDKWKMSVQYMPEVLRRQVFVTHKGIQKAFGVNIHSVPELNRNGSGTTLFRDDLDGHFSLDRQGLIIGLDLSDVGSFVMPIWNYTVEDLVLLNRIRGDRTGVAVKAYVGIAALDNTKVILGQI